VFLNESPGISFYQLLCRAGVGAIPYFIFNTLPWFLSGSHSPFTVGLGACRRYRSTTTLEQSRRLKLVWILNRALFATYKFFVESHAMLLVWKRWRLLRIHIDRTKETNAHRPEWRAKKKRQLGEIPPLLIAQQGDARTAQHCRRNDDDTSTLCR
jgi:hypothetical protein